MALQQHSEVSGRAVALGASALFGEIALSFVIASFVKWLHGDLSIFAILFCRYVFCLPLLLVYGWHRRGPTLFQVTHVGVLVRRTISGLLGLATWFLALGMIDLSLATALSQTLPIFITAMAAPMLGEKVGARRVAAVLAGFVGVMVLLGPVDISSLGLGVAFGLAAPFFAALMFIYLRQLGQSEAPVSTALWYNMAGVVFAFLLGAADGTIGQVFSGGLEVEIWLMMIGIGVLSSFQQMLMALSHTYAPASVLAPVHYTAIPLGVLTGIVLFGETITLSFIAGVVIILAANYYILVRERARKQG